MASWGYVIDTLGVLFWRDHISKAAWVLYVYSHSKIQTTPCCQKEAPFVMPSWGVFGSKWLCQSCISSLVREEPWAACNDVIAFPFGLIFHQGDGRRLVPLRLTTLQPGFFWSVFFAWKLLRDFFFFLLADNGARCNFFISHSICAEALQNTIFWEYTLMGGKKKTHTQYIPQFLNNNI